MQIVYYDPELDPVLNEAIEFLDAQLSQLQQQQIPQIQPQVQQPAQKQQQIPISENLSNENDSDNSMDIVFSIRRNITFQIPHALTIQFYIIPGRQRIIIHN